MPVNAPDPATRGVATYLSEHPGLHDLDTIAQAAGTSASIAGKVLKKLVEATPQVVRVEGTGADRKWTWALPAQHGTAEEPKRESANFAAEKTSRTEQRGSGPRPNEQATAPTPPAEPTGSESGNAAPEPASADGTAAPQRDADQTIMHAARTLAAAQAPMSTADIAAAGFLSPKSLHLLTALRALAAGDLIDCSRPFAPDDPDCTWQWTGTDQTEFLHAAAEVMLEDAPDSATCPTCGTVKAIPGIAKDRKRGGNVRGDGKPRLGKDELAAMVKAWVAAPENAGETVKVGDVVRELRALHGDRISRHSHGSVSKALDKLTGPDPAHQDQSPLLTLESDSPITYRIRALPKG